MSGFQELALVVSQKATTVTSDESGSLSIVVRNDHLQTYNGLIEQQVAYTSEVASISGDLQGQISAITVPTSATFLSDYDDRYVNESDLTDTLSSYTLLSTTASISGDLQGQIDELCVQSTGISGSDTTVNGYLQITINGVSYKLATVQ